MVFAFLSIISLGITTYLVKMPIDYDADDLSIKKEYLVNKRTLKIHKMDCSAIDKMSEKNKKIINDSIINLTSNGYIICNKCNAGIKRKNELAVNVLNKLDDLLFGEDIKNMPVKDRYLQSIDIMGEWYVSNIATYETRFYDNASILAIENYYRNKNKIKQKGNINCYPCEYLVDSDGGYNKAGDDCVRFMFSCLNKMDKRFVNTLSKYSKLKWSNINSWKLFKENANLQYAMQKLGFEIYDFIPSFIDLNNDGYYEGIINRIDNSFKLQKGDILSRDGHIHFYLNDNENFGWGKVNNVYPQNSVTYINYQNHTIVCNGEIFTRVYRYVGEIED